MKAWLFLAAALVTIAAATPAAQAQYWPYQPQPYYPEYGKPSYGPETRYPIAPPPVGRWVWVQGYSRRGEWRGHWEWVP